MSHDINLISHAILYPEVITEEKVDEAVDIKKIIDELISTSWSGDNESQMKAVQLLKGVALSDDPAANTFMKALDKATSGMSSK